MKAIQTIALIACAAAIAWVGFEIRSLNNQLRDNPFVVKVPEIEIPEVQVSVSIPDEVIQVSIPDEVAVTAKPGKFHSSVGNRMRPPGGGPNLPPHIPLVIKSQD